MSEGLKQVTVGAKEVLVPTVDLPWINEWDWDEDAGQGFRIEDGRPVFLYHEILKRHQDDDLFFILSAEQIVGVFGSHPGLQTLLELWEVRKEQAGEVLLPSPLEILAGSLTSALHIYFEWYADGLTHIYKPDPEGVTPGELFSRRRRGKLRHTTLGEFYDEFTGDWQPDEDSPAGLSPMMYDDVFSLATDQIILMLLYAHNQAEPEPLWEKFEELNLSLGELSDACMDILEDYPLPA